MRHEHDRVPPPAPLRETPHGYTVHRPHTHALTKKIREKPSESRREPLPPASDPAAAGAGALFRVIGALMAALPVVGLCAVEALEEVARKFLLQHCCRPEWPEPWTKTLHVERRQSRDQSS